MAILREWTERRVRTFGKPMLVDTKSIDNLLEQREADANFDLDIDCSLERYYEYVTGRPIETSCA
eukprot:752902-Hanusia_phi.AAC.1